MFYFTGKHAGNLNIVCGECDHEFVMDIGLFEENDVPFMIKENSIYYKYGVGDGIISCGQCGWNQRAILKGAVGSSIFDINDKNEIEEHYSTPFKERMKRISKIHKDPSFKAKKTRAMEREEVEKGEREEQIAIDKATNIPKCQTCGSERVEKIGGLNKAGAVGLFGIFSLGHISKTFKCNNCGYKW